MASPRISFRRRPKPPKPAAKPTLEDAKKLLDTSAITNRNLLVGFYALLLTALLSCLGITDEQLLIVNTPVSLPILNIKLPISAFVVVLPLVFMVVHFDLLHNLKEHKRKLRVWVAAWEEKYPANNPATASMNAAVSEQLFPFFYDFAWLHLNDKEVGSINGKLLPWLCWVLYCWAPYTVLVIFFIRFADLQDNFFTGWHLCLILLDVAWMYWYWPRFGKKKAGHWFWRSVRKVLNLPCVLMGVSSLAGCWSLGLYCLILRHLDFDGSPDIVNIALFIEESVGIVLVPRLVLVNYHINIDDNNLKIAKLMKLGKPDVGLWEYAEVSLVDLRYRRFGFAKFENMVMPRGNFSGAKLQGANLSSAQLQGAEFGGAQLQGSNLRSAQLQGSNLRSAQLQGAYLYEAQLQGANLGSAKLQGANLGSAQLQGADLGRAQLQGANLGSAQLQGVDLGGAKLQGADLRSAQLQGADLGKAKLEGADLDKTGLRAAILPDVVQFSATIGEPDWSKFEPLLLNEDWTKNLSARRLNDLQKRISEIEKRNKTFTMPNLPTKDSQKFAQAWKDTVCLNKAVAKGMFHAFNNEALARTIFNDKSNFYYLIPEFYDRWKFPDEITDTDLNTYMNGKTNCKPYQALANLAIKYRKERLSEKPLGRLGE